MGWGNKSLLKWSWSHDQGGHPYMVKTLKTLLLWNQKKNDFKTWYASSGAQVLASLLKWWLWVDLDLSYGKVKFGPLCFCIFKCMDCFMKYENVAFSVVPRISAGDAENWSRVWVWYGFLFWHTFGTVCCFFHSDLPSTHCTTCWKWLSYKNSG